MQLATTIGSADADLVQKAPEQTRAPSLGVVDPGFRLFVPGSGSERAFRVSLAAVALVYLLAIVGVVAADWVGLIAPEPPRDQRGQLEGPPSLDVEIVEAPSLDAKSKQSREGADAPQQAEQPTPPTSPPTPQVEPVEKQTPPTPPQPETPPQDAKETPETPPDKPVEKTAEQTPEKAADKVEQQQPAKERFALPEQALDGFDLSFKRYVQALDAAAAQRQNRKQSVKQQSQNTQTALLSGASRIQGRAKSGRTDAYAQSVIAALIRSKPPPFALVGSVLVSFEIAANGSLKFVKVLHSSGNTAMDQEAINAIRRAVFDPPPAGYDPADLTYIIHYIFD